MSWIKETWIKYEEILPNYDKVTNAILDELAKVYKGFIDEGKFYRTERYGYRDSIVEDEGISGEPYKTIGDWCEELTGEMGSNWIPERFEERLREIVEDKLDCIYCIDFDSPEGEVLYEKYPDIEDDRGSIVSELQGEIMDISIDAIESRLLKLKKVDL